MNPVRLILVVALLAVPACTTAGANTLDAEARVEAVEASAHAPRRFELSLTAGEVEVAVRGVVEDDYRYRGTVAVDGQDFYEEVVVDDRRWVRLLSLVEGGASLSTREMGALSGLFAQARGDWFLDAGGAPPEFAATDARTRLLGPTTVLNAVRRLDALATDPESVGLVRSARPYDPESATYLERDDKFDRHVADGDRFDVIPAPYDAEAIFGDGVPADLQEALEPYALYTSLWIENGRVTRIETFFDVDRETVTADLQAVIEATAQGAGVPTLAAPPVPQPFRETLTMDYPRSAVRIEPPQTALRLELPELGATSPAG